MPSSSLTYQGPDLSPFQGEYRGLIFGEGTDYVIDGEITGLLAVESRADDPIIPHGDGAFPTMDYAAKDTITFPLAIVATPGTEDLRQKLAGVALTFRLTRGVEHWLRWHGAYGVRRWRTRPRRLAIAENAESARSGIWRATVEMTLSDPRGYDDIFETALVYPFKPAAGSSAGWELPDVDLPLDITLAQQQTAGGLATLYNTGSTTAWPLIQIQNTGAGDTTEVKLLNIDTGQSLTVATLIQHGQILTLDMDRLARGTAGPHVHIAGTTRYGHWTPPRTPFGLEPGANRIRFEVTGGTAVARFTYRNTHI